MNCPACGAKGPFKSAFRLRAVMARDLPALEALSCPTCTHPLASNRCRCAGENRSNL